MNIRLTAFFVSCAAALYLSAARAQPFSELNAAEQSVLRPLAGEWDAMNVTRKKKWRELAVKYPTLSPEEQQRLSARMQGWSRMSPDDRRAARDQFREISAPQATRPEAREHIKKQWQEYRNLPSDERARLHLESKQQGKARGNEAVKRAGVPPLPASPAPQNR